MKMKENKKAKKAVDEEDHFGLFTIITINEKLVHEKRKVSFSDDIKFKTLHADLSPSMQEANMMCTTDVKSFYTQKYLNQQFRCIMLQHQQ